MASCVRDKTASAVERGQTLLAETCDEVEITSNSVSALATFSRLLLVAGLLLIFVGTTRRAERYEGGRTDQGQEGFATRQGLGLNLATTAKNSHPTVSDSELIASYYENAFEYHSDHAIDAEGDVLEEGGSRQLLGHLHSSKGTRGTTGQVDEASTVSEDSTIHKNSVIVNSIINASHVKRSTITNCTLKTTNVSAGSILDDSIIEQCTVANSMISASELLDGNTTGSTMAAVLGSSFVFSDSTLTGGVLNFSTVADVEATLCVFVESDFAGGKCEETSMVWRSNLTSSTLSNATIINSIIINSTINGSSVIVNSTIVNSTVVASTITSSIMENQRVQNTMLVNNQQMGLNITGKGEVDTWGTVSTSHFTNDTISKDSYVSDDSTLDHATIVNASYVRNSTVAFSTLSRSQANYTQLSFAASEACFLNDSILQGDPDTELYLHTVDSTLSGSVVRGSASRVAHSQLEDSAADHSTVLAALVRATFLQRANATSSNFTNSMLIDSSALRSEVSNSTCSEGSTMFIAHVSVSCNLTNVTVINSTIINSTIVNSTVVQAEVIDSTVIDGIVMRATLQNVSSTRGSLFDLVLEDALIIDQEITGGKLLVNTSEDTAPSPPSVNQTEPGVPISPEPPSGTMTDSNGTRSMISKDSVVDNNSRLTAAVIKGSTVTASNISYTHVDQCDVNATSMSFANSTASTFSSTQVHGAAGMMVLSVEKSHIDSGSLVGTSTSIIRSNLTKMTVRESRLSDTTSATSSIRHSDADTSDMIDCTVLGAHLEGSNIAQLAVVDSEMFTTLFTEGSLSGSTMTSTNANNCTILNTTSTACRLVGATLTNASLITTHLDQGTVVDSRSDSSEMVSVAITESTILASYITDGVVSASVLSDATCVRVSVMNTTTQDFSTLMDVTLINSTVINSTITSSTVVNATIINSTIGSASIISAMSINSTIIEVAVEAKEYVAVTLQGTRNSSSLAPSTESPSAKKVQSPSMKTASQSRPQSHHNSTPFFTVGIMSGFATVLGVALIASMSLRRRLCLGHVEHDGENPELLWKLMPRVVYADTVSVEGAPIDGQCIGHSYGSTSEAVNVELVAARDS